MYGMITINRFRVAVSVAGVLVFAVSLTAMRFIDSYKPVFHSCVTGTDLVIAGGTDTSINHQQQQLIDQWNAGARGRDPRARLIEVSDIADLQHSQLMAAEQSGSCGYDALMLDVVWTAEFAADGLIRPIPSEDLSNPQGFFPSVLQTGQWNGRQYGIPFSSNVGLLYYKKAGPAPPHSWNDLVNRGYAGQLANYEGLTVNALEAIWNDGGSSILTGASTQVTPAVVKAKILPVLDKLARTARKAGPLGSSRAFHEVDAQNAFANGDATLLRDWPDAYRPLAADPRQRTGSDLAFGAEPLPGGHGALGGTDFAIATASQHPVKQVLDLINFLTSEKSEDKLFACAGIAPTRWVALGSAYSCPQDTHDAGPSQAQNAGFTNLLRTALNDALPRPVTPHYTAFSTTFRGCVERVLDGDPPLPEEFADAVSAALEGKGTYPSCHT